MLLNDGAQGSLNGTRPHPPISPRTFFLVSTPAPHFSQGLYWEAQVWQILKVMNVCKKRPTKETYKRDLQKRPTKETSRCELFRDKVKDYVVEPRYCKCVSRDTYVYVYMCVSKETYKRDVKMWIVVEPRYCKWDKTNAHMSNETRQMHICRTRPSKKTRIFELIRDKIMAYILELSSCKSVERDIHV